MGKSVGSSLLAALAQPTTTTATCWLLTRTDSTVFAFTDHDTTLVVSGVPYEPALSFSRTAIRTDSASDPTNLDVRGVLDSSSITDGDLRAGKFDGCQVQMFTVDYANLGYGILKNISGELGKVSLGDYGFNVEFLSLMKLLGIVQGNVYQPTCRVDLGSTKCGIDLSALGVSDTVATVTSKRVFTGTTATNAGPLVKTYTASTIFFRQSRKVLDTTSGINIFSVNDAVEITGSYRNDQPHTVRTLITNSSDEAVVNNHGPLPVWGFYCDVQNSDIINEPPGKAITIASTTLGYFDLGYVLWNTGLNAGLKQEVRTWSGPTLKTVTLFLPMPYPITVGDTYTIYPGCDKRIQTCFAKFNNVVNFRGEPFVPGQNSLLTYPNAR